MRIQDRIEDGIAKLDEKKKKLMVDYLLLKVKEEDWHGVCDASADLRDIEAEKSAHVSLLNHCKLNKIVWMEAQESR